MNLDVTISATCVLRVLVVCWTSRFIRSHAVVHAVTSQAQVIHRAELQHPRVSRPMRYVTRDTTVRLHRSMFERERSLLVCVTLDTSSIGSRRESRLFEFKPAVRIVAIAALHRAFQHLVMERQIELVLRFAMTTETKLRFARFEQPQI